MARINFYNLTGGTHVVAIFDERECSPALTLAIPGDFVPQPNLFLNPTEEPFTLPSFLARPVVRITPTRARLAELLASAEIAEGIELPDDFLARVALYLDRCEVLTRLQTIAMTHPEEANEYAALLLSGSMATMSEGLAKIRAAHKDLFRAFEDLKTTDPALYEAILKQMIPPTGPSFRA